MASSFASIGGGKPKVATAPPPKSYMPTSSGLSNALSPFQSGGVNPYELISRSQPGPLPSGGALGNVAGGGGVTTPQVTGPVTTYTPTQLTNTAREDPRMAGLYGELSNYQGQVSQGADQDAVLAMQRQRDAMSGIAKEFGEVAASRGLSGTGVESAGMRQILDPRQLSALNAQGLSDARGRQQSLYDQRSGQAQAIAADQKNQQALGLEQWKAQNQMGLSAAQLEASQRNQNTQNNMELMRFALQAAMGAY